MAGGYYTLLGSLPHLPHFERAQRLPITRLKLEQRLRMLDPEEVEILLEAEVLAAWQLTLAKPRSEAALLEHLQSTLTQIRQPALRRYLEFRMSVQTVLAALRRRRAGQSGPADFAGFGPWTSAISRHWNEPDFRLAQVLPWLPAARQLLESRAVLDLERLLLNLHWQELGRIGEAEPFGFGAVVAYLFRWDLLRYWLSRDVAAAQRRFQELIREVTHGP